MTVKEWEKVFEMSQDKNLYHNLCTSLFPTIHGKNSIHMWHKLEIQRNDYRTVIHDFLKQIMKVFSRFRRGLFKSFMKGQIHDST